MEKMHVKNENRIVEICIVFAIGIVTYYIFISQYLMHNHAPRLPWLSPGDQTFAGRWFYYILAQINYSADIPVLMPLEGVAMAVLSAQISLRVWNLNLDLAERIIVASAIVSFPFSLSFFYYTWITPLFYAGWVFAILAAWFSRRDSWFSVVAAALLVSLGFASYQTTSIGTFAVLVTTGAISDLTRQQNGVDFPLKRVFMRLFAASVAFVSGLFIYMLSLKLLSVRSYGDSQVTSISQVPQKIWDAAVFSFEHLWLTQPDIMRGQKILLLAVLIAAVLTSVYKHKRDPKRLALSLALWISSIVCTKAILIIVKPAGYERDLGAYRYFTPLGFLHAFTMAFLLAGLAEAWSTIRYIGVVLTAAIVLRFVQADLVRQGVLMRAQQHDLAIANRIIDRIETLPDLDTTQTYDLVRIGRYSNYRNELMAYLGKNAELGDSHLDTGEITEVWADKDVYKMLGAAVKFKPGPNRDFREKAKFAKENLLQGRKPWPHKSSVFIYGQTIYVYVR